MSNQITIKKENEEQATLEELQFIFSQSERLLTESVGSGESVLSRSTILMTVLLAIATSEISYMITALTSDPVPGKMLGTIGIVCIYNLFTIYSLSTNLFGHQYSLAGSQPHYLLNNWYYENKQDEDRLKSMMIQEIKSYQDRINTNEAVNKNRWKCFENTMRLTLATPLIFIFCYTVFTIFL
ncbi:hypothetical protein FPZ42_07760 [Mucilaginibacter achroorhodeus]|uniref:SMODS and SLOG-associating 2TM effector domain-containing protein n=1 Tax=Mucilaginibacter achroorhodeus TaxID=2599294 RepID=A0A563U6E6_9SPHI|nr:hypothetical protein [Mucilaginibacter achroorhodeus]TWR26922.1 hypothetical protein FPZ42_07760 [Mucilaginibacter achroorhodeus]